MFSCKPLSKMNTQPLQLYHFLIKTKVTTNTNEELFKTLHNQIEEQLNQNHSLHALA